MAVGLIDFPGICEMPEMTSSTGALRLDVAGIPIASAPVTAVVGGRYVVHAARGIEGIAALRANGVVAAKLGPMPIAVAETPDI
jgi:hypothetical protein